MRTLNEKTQYKVLIVSPDLLNPAQRRQFYSWITAKQLTELPVVPKMVKREYFPDQSDSCRQGEVQGV